MRAFLFTISILASGCLDAYKASFVTGSVVKEFTTESYDAYSEVLNEKIDECCRDGVCNPESKEPISRLEFDLCLGDGFKKEDHDKIKKAVNAYYEAATVHSALMIASESKSKEDMRAATDAIYQAAMALLAQLPGGEGLVKKLKFLSGRSR